MDDISSRRVRSLLRQLDPRATAAVDRQPVVEEVDAVIIGMGFSGICLSYKLREVFEAGRIRVFEKGADVGGTWYW